MQQQKDQQQQQQQENNLDHSPLYAYAQLAYEHVPNKKEVYEDGYFDPSKYNLSDDFVNKEYLLEQKTIEQLDNHPHQTSTSTSSADQRTK